MSFWDGVGTGVGFAITLYLIYEISKMKGGGLNLIVQSAHHPDEFDGENK